MTSYLVSGQHLSTVLVDDRYEAWWLDPSLTIDLDWDAFLAEDCNLNTAALCRQSDEGKLCS